MNHVHKYVCSSMAYYNPAQGHPQGQYPAPIVYYAAPAITYQQAVTKHYGQYYAKETSTGLGATQIVVACVSIAAGIMAIVSGAECYYIGVGIWAGALVRRINFIHSFRPFL